jgi:hypothetical protein
MDNVIYNIIDNLGRKIGYVSEDLLLTTLSNELEFNNIIDLLKYIESQNYHLNDMQGDLYSLNIHNELIKQINKFGIGYMIR